MQCFYCKNEINIFNSHSINEGYLCKNCYSKLPKGYSVKSYNSIKTKMVLDYIESCKIKFKHIPTASYGSLSIDELNGTFALLNNKQKQVYLYGLDLNCFGISCTNIHIDKNNHVYCDIQFTADFRYPVMSFSQIIKKNVKCQSKRVGDNKLEWFEPADVSLFRNLLLQMLETAGQKLIKKHECITKLNYEVELYKAKCLFMINEYYDKDELKKKRRLLMKAFHPDEGSETKEAQLINEAYNRLLNELED